MANNRMKEELFNDRQRILYTKYNTLLLKEKLLLNEKMIFQRFFKREYKKELKNIKFENFFATNLYKPYSLDLSQKYDVVRNELQNANNKWEAFEKTKDEKTDELLATNQEIILNIKDIKMEVYELNRKIDIQSENPKSGKINAEIFHKFFEEKFKKLENYKKKLTEQNLNLFKQINAARKKIEKKDKSNELQFIDFHQLQIENKKYVKEVDEKNKLLLKLKMTIGKITQDKNKCKDKLNEEIKKLQTLRLKTLEKEKQIDRINDMIENQKEEEKRIETLTKNLNRKQMKSNIIICVKIILLK
jgi:hypothetical protein